MSERALQPGAPAATQRARQTLLRAVALDKSFHDAGREIQVLRKLELELCAGGETAIVGQSGVGKSTLLHVLGSLDRPSAGKVYFAGRDIFALGARELAGFRNRTVGFVFQFHYLLVDFSALENVMMPALIARLAPSEARRRAVEVLELVGLGEKLERRPAELSGGEQQRVAVARAVVMRPRLVLADEPTGNLDPETAAEVYQLFRRLNREFETTLVVATHNEGLARTMGRTLRLRDGQLFEEAGER
jgi:lipoprotein-releasing system ATP-binding protein